MDNRKNNIDADEIVFGHPSEFNELADEDDVLYEENISFTDQGDFVIRKRGVMKRIKTFEDACRELGDDHPFVVQYNKIYDVLPNGAGESESKDVLAYLKLRVICAALNMSITPKFTGWNWRYHPEISLNREKTDDPDRVPSSEGDHPCTVIGSRGHSEYCGYRVTLRFSDICRYCGDQFRNIWRDFLFP